MLPGRLPLMQRRDILSPEVCSLSSLNSILDCQEFFCVSTLFVETSILTCHSYPPRVVRNQTGNTFSTCWGQTLPEQVHNTGSASKPEFDVQCLFKGTKPLFSFFLIPLFLPVPHPFSLPLQSSTGPQMMNFDFSSFLSFFLLNLGDSPSPQ